MSFGMQANYTLQKTRRMHLHTVLTYSQDPGRQCFCTSNGSTAEHAPLQTAGIASILLPNRPTTLWEAKVLSKQTSNWPPGGLLKLTCKHALWQLSVRTVLEGFLKEILRLRRIVMTCGNRSNTWWSRPSFDMTSNKWKVQKNVVYIHFVRYLQPLYAPLNLKLC